MKHLILIIIIGVALCTGIDFFAASAENKQQQIPVRVAYMKTMTAMYFFIAEEKGYFKDEGLDTEFILCPGPALLDAVVAGRADITGPPIQAALALEYNMPGRVKVIALPYTDSYDNETTRLIVRQDSNIKSIADLKGKKLAVSSKIMIVTVRTMLQNFFDPNDVTFIIIPFEEHANALQSGGVDAAYTQEPTVTFALQTGNFREVGEGEFFKANYLVKPYYTAVVVVSSSFIAKYPTGGKKLQRALEKAIKFYEENESEARAIIGKYTHYPSEVVQKMHIFPMHMPWEVDKVALQKTVDIFVENGFLKGQVDVVKMFLE